MVSAITDRLPDHLPEPPGLPVDVGEVADRLRGLTEAAASTARQATSSARNVTSTARQAGGSKSMALPLALVMALLTGVGIFMLIRSRRATTEVGSASPAGSYAHT